MEDEREEEITALSSIYPEIVVDPRNPFKLSLSIPVAPPEPIKVRFQHAELGEEGTQDGLRDEVRTIKHLPPLTVTASLSDRYPNHSPPHVEVDVDPAWLDFGKLKELEDQGRKLWDEYGRCQILFTYFDYVQQAAERMFDLGKEVVISSSLKDALVEFDEAREKKIFEIGSYDCGVCLEPKRGAVCYRIRGCGHVFCQPCLRDYYNSAITEGDIGNVTCLEPSCGQGKPGDLQRKSRTLHPRELLQIGICDSQARRYVELKRKKKLESDKSTIYCPRTWCQAPTRNNKYPPIPDNLEDYVDSDTDDLPSDSDPPPAYTKDTPESKLPDPADRLVICSNPRCGLAFCRVCFGGWHGEFARCWPRNPGDLSEEEKASYDYIRQHTSPCPTCTSPTQKTMGCNHMKCFQCNTHFCYLCSAWLEPGNPYQHFNDKFNGCYMRLWELEEGDEGQAHLRRAGQAAQAQVVADDAARAAAEEARRQAEEQVDAQRRERRDRNVARAVPPIDEVLLEAEANLELQQQIFDELAAAAARRRANRQANGHGPAHLPPPGPIDPMHAAALRREEERARGPEPEPQQLYPVQEPVHGNRRRARARHEAVLNAEDEQQQQRQEVIENDAGANDDQGEPDQVLRGGRRGRGRRGRNGRNNDEQGANGQRRQWRQQHEQQVQVNAPRQHGEMLVQEPLYWQINGERLYDDPEWDDALDYGPDPPAARPDAGIRGFRHQPGQRGRRRPQRRGDGGQQDEPRLIDFNDRLAVPAPAPNAVGWDIRQYRPQRQQQQQQQANGHLENEQRLIDLDDAPAAAAPAAQANGWDERQNAALRRFVELAVRDEEDEWDSDELEDDAAFHIR